jgi:hypothetical protein
MGPAPFESQLKAALGLHITSPKVLIASGGGSSSLSITVSTALTERHQVSPEAKKIGSLMLVDLCHVHLQWPFEAEMCDFAISSITDSTALTERHQVSPEAEK